MMLYGDLIPLPPFCHNGRRLKRGDLSRGTHVLSMGACWQCLPAFSVLWRHTQSILVTVNFLSCHFTLLMSVYLFLCVYLVVRLQVVLECLIEFVLMGTPTAEER